jgi:hypothetical protein
MVIQHHDNAPLGSSERFCSPPSAGGLGVPSCAQQGAGNSFAAMAGGRGNHGGIRLQNWKSEHWERAVGCEKGLSMVGGVSMSGISQKVEEELPEEVCGSECSRVGRSGEVLV